MVNRRAAQRISDVLRRLQTEANVWVATASPDGRPHLVPLSLHWTGETIWVTTPADTVTVRNASATGRVRASLDSADDVTIIDATVDVTDIDEVDPAAMDAYVARVGWDPRRSPGAWSLLVITPDRVQAWNGEPEIRGRTIMRSGAWIEPPEN